MTYLLLRSLVVCFLAGCDCVPAKPDAAIDDSGVDGGVDAGRIDVAGGCYRRPEGQKFILYFETADPVCAAVSFRRADAGFAPLFAGGPWPQRYVRYDDGGVWQSDYEIDDARVGLCSMPYEQSDGKLSQSAARLDDFRGTLTIHFQAGRALGYDTEGSLAFFGRRYWFSTVPDGAGLTEGCIGP